MDHLLVLHVVYKVTYWYIVLDLTIAFTCTRWIQPVSRLLQIILLFVNYDVNY